MLFAIASAATLIIFDTLSPFIFASLPLSPFSMLLLILLPLIFFQLSAASLRYFIDAIFAYCLSPSLRCRLIAMPLCRDFRHAFAFISFSSLSLSMLRQAFDTPVFAATIISFAAADAMSRRFFLHFRRFSPLPFSRIFRLRRFRH